MKDMIIGALLVLMGLFIYHNAMDIKAQKAEMHGKIITAEVSV